MPSSNGPLSGITVCDFTQFLAGPFATQILGDLGATVIKIESPRGDLTRHLPPHFVGEDSAYYHSVNRNKQSVVLDLKSSEGTRIARDLASSSDLVVENFRPGVMDRFGLGYADLSERSPTLIMCSISGFGQDGPYRDLPAYDMIVQAMAGTMHLNGEVDGPPLRTGVPIADIGAGLYATIGVLAALEERRKTGRGQHLDIAMLDAQLTLLSYQAVYYLISGVEPPRQGGAHDSIPTYRTFTAADDHEIAVTANTDGMWEGLCRALDVAELIDDARFATNVSRWEHRDELWEPLEAAFGSYDSVTVVQRLRQEGVPAAPIHTLGTALTDPHITHRGMVVEATDADGTSVPLVGNPIRQVGDSGGGQTHRFPPRVGSDTAEVLRQRLNISQEQIDELTHAGAFG